MIDIGKRACLAILFVAGCSEEGSSGASDPGQAGGGAGDDQEGADAGEGEGEGGAGPGGDEGAGHDDTGEGEGEAGDGSEGGEGEDDVGDGGDGEGGEGEGEQDPGGQGEGEGEAVVDHGPLICPGDDFDACGGDLLGRWKLLDFCTPDNRLAGKPIECGGPGEDEPKCQGGRNARQCILGYGGTANFTADGDLFLELGVATWVRYAFEDDCLLTLYPAAADAEAACDALANPPRLSCTYSDGLCTCTADGEPQSERQPTVYTVEGGTITVAGRATGAYCVGGGRLTIDFDPFGPEGWGAWLLERP